ncbi:MAG: hypothetical protein AB7K24_19080 [Gemmataceae bacterium]
MRKLINDRPGTVVVVVVLVMVAATFPYWWPTLASAPSGPTGPQAFFYDLNTRELFVADAVPGPIETASGPFEGGPAGVRAHVFACGRCVDKDLRFIAWLSKPDKDGEGEEALLVKRPEDAEWVPVSSPAGARLVNEATQRCDRVQANYCHPEHGAP